MDGFNSWVYISYSVPFLQRKENETGIHGLILQKGKIGFREISSLKWKEKQGEMNECTRAEKLLILFASFFFFFFALPGLSCSTQDLSSLIWMEPWACCI